MSAPWPTLSVITVVKDDPAGLRATLASTAILPDTATELVVVDGSTSPVAARILDELGVGPPTRLRAGPDSGIYEAMNQGLELATGRYALFLNAGDRLHQGVEVDRLYARLRESQVTLTGYCIEGYRADAYLRPGLAHPQRCTPAHQATLFPHSFYREHRYRLDLPVRADGIFTGQALAAGHEVLDLVIAEFALGGVSSRYARARDLRRRLAESPGVAARARLVAKFASWQVLGPRRTYRLLAAPKYTRLRPGTMLPGGHPWLGPSAHQGS